jgi:hypothetical protein
VSKRGAKQTERPLQTALPAGRPDVDVRPRLDRSWPKDGFGPIATIIALLPDPDGLAERTLVVVRGSDRARPIRLLRWLLPKRREAHPAVRCTALLARGYRDVGAAVDPNTGERVAWGYTG